MKIVGNLDLCCKHFSVSVESSWDTETPVFIPIDLCEHILFIGQFIVKNSHSTAPDDNIRSSIILLDINTLVLSQN